MNSNAAINKNNVIPVVIGSSYNAYGVVRGFGEEGIASILITTAERNFVQYSKYLERHVVMTDVNKDEEAFISELVALGKELAPRKGMVFPTHDEQVSAIAAHKKELAPYYEMPYSDLEVCSRIMDKANFRRVCEEQGIPTIKERLVRSLDEAIVCPDVLRLPLIAKANSWNMDVIRSFGGKIAIFFDRESYLNQIRNYYEAMPDGELLVQEYIEDCGDLTPNINGFSDREGNLRCVHIAGKIRQYPPQTGTSTAFQAVDAADEKYADIVDYTKRILSAYGFYGLFGIEFIFDPVEKVYKVIEMNTRSEFLNYLPTARGQNLAYLIYQYHLGLDVDIPYYPLVENMTMSVPFNDYFYSVHLNKLNYPGFVLTKKQWRETLPGPTEHYGLTAKDAKSYVMAYVLSAVRGVGAYIRIKNHIPDTVRVTDFFLKGKKS